VVFFVVMMNDFAFEVVRADLAQKDFFGGPLLNILFVVGRPLGTDFVGVGKIQNLAFAGEGVGVNGFDAFETFEIADAWMDCFTDQAFESRQTATQIAGAFFVFIDEDFRGDGVEKAGLLLGEMTDKAALAKLFKDVVGADAVDVCGLGDGGNWGRAVLDAGEINFRFFFV